MGLENAQVAQEEKMYSPEGDKNKEKNSQYNL